MIEPMPDETKGQVKRPWWVRVANPLGSARRRNVLLKTILLGVLNLFWATCIIALAFIEGSKLHP
jgi:hypothetical protein